MAAADEDVKAVALAIIRDLPENVTWNGVLHALYVHHRTMEGIRDLDAGRSVTTAELRQSLGLTKRKEEGYGDGND